MDMPHSDQTERLVLGTILGMPERYSEIADRLTKDTWYRDVHRKIWLIVCRLHTEGEPISIATVTDEAERQGIDVGLPSELAGGMVAWSNIAGHLKKLTTMAMQRSVIKIAHNIAQDAARYNDDDASLAAARLQESVDWYRYLMGMGSPQQVVVTASDLRDQMMLPGETEDRGADAGWPNLHRIWHPAVGRLTVFHGIPGHGKSTMVHALMVRMSEQYGTTWAVYSPEHWPGTAWFRELAGFYLGKPWHTMTDNEQEASIFWLEQYFKLIRLRPSEDATIDRILRYATDAGANGILIDPFNKHTRTQTRDESLTDYIIRCTTQVEEWGQRHNAYPWVVAHPAKLQKPPNRRNYPKPGPYDIWGGSAWMDAAANIILVYRDMESGRTHLYTQKIKRQGYQGELGVAWFEFSRDKYEFRPAGGKVYDEPDEDPMNPPPPEPEAKQERAL